MLYVSTDTHIDTLANCAHILFIFLASYVGDELMGYIRSLYITLQETTEVCFKIFIPFTLPPRMGDIYRSICLPNISDVPLFLFILNILVGIEWFKIAFLW